MSTTPNPPLPNPRRGLPAVPALAAMLLVLLGLGVFPILGFRDRARIAAAPAEIRAVLDAQADAWNAGDLDGFMTGYWNSEELKFYSGGDVTKGWQGTLDRYRRKYQSKDAEMGHLEFTDLEIEVLGPDVAIVRGRWKLTRSKDSPSGLYTLLIRRFSDGWKIVSDHTSAADPPKPS
ncbi:YybH family protein [Fimbriiglobus ruber]|uniref:L-asparaginase n=1 Tax=Fimbriiglobus ruber TaxID=1908690 RepID=A0A225DM72_9BACT|nr:DUF4440 domain-containing protein [Fimbriiglobus ruber]OWK38309.1 L-asparaginase [Fimbriiglobus ruber]